MPQFAIRHRTVYRYSAPVTLGPQRLVLRPRDSHDLDLLDSTLILRPPAAATRWLHDVYANSIAVLEFVGETSELAIESRLLVDHFGLDEPEFAIEPFAQSWPFMYRAEEWPDLELWTRRQWNDPEGRLQRWVRELALDRVEVPTRDLLVAIMSRIKRDLPYEAREEEGIRPPLQTLREGGSCRDFAVLMTEAVRSLGFAARFVSGYLHVAPPNGGAEAVGGGATHAWVQVYLPGAGWVEFDPTNALYGGRDLIRVAIARDPAAVSPISGSFIGPAGVSASLEVEVEVRRLEHPAASLAELEGGS
jgi:transglutaminase-like putative cysteine protease